jgi:hypothetical protein
MTPLDADEQAFLSKHVSVLRGPKRDYDTRGRFRDGSTLQDDFQAALVADDVEYLAIAGRLVNQLATSMNGTNSPDCVVAFLISEDESQASSANILKLDADVEAAELIQELDVIRLHVFQNLLPRPGDMQKGISWPDARSNSSLIVLDTNTTGTAKYFQNAYRIDASPTAVATENALMAEIQALNPRQVPVVVAAVGQGGEAGAVVERIRRDVPSFMPTSPELGAGDALPGIVRPNFLAARKTSYKADEIELRLPLSKLGQVRTTRVGLGFVTTIQTSEPLTPIDDSDVTGS